MATPFLKVYDAFLARITADEWTLEEELAIVERDWQELLKMAIARFKYPRVSLEIEEVDAAEDDSPQLRIYQFQNNLTNAGVCYITGGNVIEYLPSMYNLECEKCGQNKTIKLIKNIYTYVMIKMVENYIQFHILYMMEINFIKYIIAKNQVKMRMYIIKK